MAQVFEQIAITAPSAILKVKDATEALFLLPSDDNINVIVFFQFSEFRSITSKVKKFTGKTAANVKDLISTHRTTTLNKNKSITAAPNTKQPEIFLNALITFDAINKNGDSNSDSDNESNERKPASQYILVELLSESIVVKKDKTYIQFLIRRLTESPPFPQIKKLTDIRILI